MSLTIPWDVCFVRQPEFILVTTAIVVDIDIRGRGAHARKRT